MRSPRRCPYPCISVARDSNGRHSTQILFTCFPEVWTTRYVSGYYQSFTNLPPASQPPPVTSFPQQIFPCVIPTHTSQPRQSIPTMSIVLNSTTTLSSPN